MLCQQALICLLLFPFSFLHFSAGLKTHPYAPSANVSHHIFHSYLLYSILFLLTVYNDL